MSDAELLASLDVNGLPCGFLRSHGRCHGTMYPNSATTISCDACGEDRTVGWLRAVIQRLTELRGSEAPAPPAVPPVATPKETP